MEQLFKHEGVCVWGWNIYGNMNGLRKMVKPNMCVFVSYDANNLPYYIGWQPMAGGNLGLMLYSDERCSEYFTGTVSVDDVCSNYVANNNNNNNNTTTNNNNNSSSAVLPLHFVDHCSGIQCNPQCVTVLELVSPVDDSAFLVGIGVTAMVALTIGYVFLFAYGRVLFPPVVPAAATAQGNRPQRRNVYDDNDDNDDDDNDGNGNS